VTATARIAAANLTFGHDRRAPILDGWEASFFGGEVAAITGPSGRGKSTLLYILGLMLRPDSGSLTVDTAPLPRTVAAPSPRQIDASHLTDSQRSAMRASAYGFVFQDAALDPTRTILDNVTEVALYAGLRRADVRHRALELLDELGVSLRAHARPGQVSGGQAQRIAVARALLHSPAIVLADEPTGNLDTESTRVVVEALRRQAREGAAVVIVTHEQAVVDQCDRVIQL
jgi:ABC-type lipoprotein export system ATPase subunit